MSSKIYKKVATASVWICKASCADCVFYLLGEVG